MPSLPTQQHAPIHHLHHAQRRQPPARSTSHTSTDYEHPSPNRSTHQMSLYWLISAAVLFLFLFH